MLKPLWTATVGSKHSYSYFSFGQVREITRVFELVNGDLSYVVQMATNLNSLQPHLKALLKKI